jgi:predicted nicotinamide N-methyase
VWDAAVAMNKWLQSPEAFRPGYFRGKKVIELGSGTGLGERSCLMTRCSLLSDC